MIEVINNKTVTDRVGDYDLTIGNDKVSTEFQSKIKMDFGKYADGTDRILEFEYEGGKGVPALESECLSMATSFGKMEWVKDAADERVLRWLTYFNSPPESNKYSLKITNWEKFKFTYQFPFEGNYDGVEYYTENGIEMVRAINPHYGDGKIYCSRPVSVEGSYTVKYGNWVDSKVTHIHRAKATDADGKTAWIPVDITNGIYTETIPQEFLDTAKYPVKINATFGHEGGASTSSWAGNYAYVHGPYTCPSSGTVTNIGREGSADSDLSILCIYGESGGAASGAVLDYTDATGNAAGGWEEPAAQVGYSVVGSTDYFIGELSDSTVNYNYDTTEAGEQAYYLLGDVYPTLHDPWLGGETGFGFDINLRITYTPSAGGGNAPTGNINGSLVGCLGGTI